MKTKFVIGLLLISAVNIHCGSLKFRDKDEQLIGAVKKVAVIAFEVNQPDSPKIGLNLGSGKSEAIKGGSLIPQQSSHVDQMYDKLASHLTKNLQWQVIPRRELISQPGYTMAFDKTMKGWQNKFPPGEGMIKYLVPQIMDYDCPRILGVQGRDELIKALGVDAIVVARMTVELTGTTVLGLGSRYPRPVLGFFVYTKGREEPAWFDGRIEGVESKQSVGKTGFIDTKLLSQLTLEQSELVFSKITK
ncbi:MAG: hypothetical protein IT289_10565 [Oligoflexia bacterium]|nr:hypothetical protein [Oligoflexia bacterium]